MLYWYASHLGGVIYSSKYKISDDDLYCESCGDSDTYLGRFETEEEAHKEYMRRMGLEDDDEVLNDLNGDYEPDVESPFGVE